MTKLATAPTSDIITTGMEALISALGPIGAARFLEQYDNGGNGDYTADKYNQKDISLDEIRNFL